ncbi:MAG: VOC family protein, partial [Chloroflexi bacterium]|nr:VOC family protein [Chloroflexota bacterium]
MITRVDKVTVYVNSQEEAKKFWTGKMGFVVTFEQEMAPGFKWIEVSPKGENLTALVLYSKESMLKTNPSMMAHPSVIFATDDIEKQWQTLKARSVEVTEIQKFPYGKFFNFK